MAVGIDACLKKTDAGLYDLEIDWDGDIRSNDSFDASIIVSWFSERRADESEIGPPELRRGWIGNEATPGFEIGSKLWLFEQTRLTQEVISRIKSAAIEALQWMIDDNFAISIDDVEVVVNSDGITLDLILRRPHSEVTKRHHTLWENTALPCVNPQTYQEVEIVGGMNLFNFLKMPKHAMDILWIYNGAQTNGTIYTGGPWHPDTTITIVNHGLLAGDGGVGGTGGEEVGGDYGGGGGGGAPLGAGGTSFGNLADGNSGTLTVGGLGVVGASLGPSADVAAGAGVKGGHAIILGHDISLVNYDTISGGGGGGGGGGDSSATGGDGGAVFTNGVIGGGVGGGSAGLKGDAIKLNGHTITYIQTGTINGAVS